MDSNGGPLMSEATALTTEPLKVSVRDMGHPNASSFTVLVWETKIGH